MRYFEFSRPDSLEQALSVLSENPGEVRPLAGGTDLIEQVKQGRHEPKIIMDLKSIPELCKLDWDPKDGLRIGAATSCSEVYQHQIVRTHFPAIVDAGMLVGSIQIQNRAAIGANVCNAAPSGDTIPALLIYEAKAMIISPRGSREVPLEKFFVGPGRTVLEGDEILMEIIVPPPAPRSHSSYLRFIPREEMDIAVVGVGSMVSLDENGTCSTARVALASVAPTPVRAFHAESILEGNPPTKILVEEAARNAVLDSSPISDVRGTAEYRKNLVEVLTSRTLTNCFNALGQTL